MNFAVTLSGSVAAERPARTSLERLGAPPLVVGDDELRAGSAAARVRVVAAAVGPLCSSEPALGSGRRPSAPARARVGLAGPSSQVENVPAPKPAAGPTRMSEGCECLLHERVTRRGASRRRSAQTLPKALLSAERPSGSSSARRASRGESPRRGRAGAGRRPRGGSPPPSRPSCASPSVKRLFSPRCSRSGKNWKKGNW